MSHHSAGHIDDNLGAVRVLWEVQYLVVSGGRGRTFGVTESGCRKCFSSLDTRRGLGGEFVRPLLRLVVVINTDNHIPLVA